MTDEVAEEAKAILFRSRNLAVEIEGAIRDAVVSQAGSIDRFHERREELTAVDHQFLFFYATSLVMLFLSSAERWTEQRIDRVIDGVSESLVRIMTYQGSTSRDTSGQIRANAAQLRKSFDTLRSNLDRLETIQNSGKSDEAAFTLILMYLRQVYPACVTMIAEGNFGLLATLQQRFWRASMSGH